MEDRTKRAVEPVVRALMDSSRAFVSAADRADLDVLAHTLHATAERRAAFAAHLNVLSDNDELPERSVEEALREWWMGLRDRLSEDHYGLLAELGRAEDQLLERYGKTLSGDDLSEPLRRVLERQRDEIARTCAHVRSLRESEKAARRA